MEFCKATAAIDTQPFISHEYFKQKQTPFMIMERTMNTGLWGARYLQQKYCAFLTIFYMQGTNVWLYISSKVYSVTIT